MKILETVAGIASFVTVDVNNVQMTAGGIRLWDKFGTPYAFNRSRLAMALHAMYLVGKPTVLALNSDGKIVGIADDPNYVGTGWLVDTDRKRLWICGSGETTRDGRITMATGPNMVAYEAPEGSAVNAVMSVAQPGSRIDVWLRRGTNEVVGVIF
ncbi:hypothetical protein ACFWVM_29155 [Nocardia fluminea]|uniref:hypothetical protein n=1 Tax=Nocardia fluminea TaxID=134984 RepID=UPI00365B04B4